MVLVDETMYINIIPKTFIKMNNDDFANFRKKKKFIVYKDKNSSDYFWDFTKYRDFDNRKISSYLNPSNEYDTRSKTKWREIVSSSNCLEEYKKNNSDNDFKEETQISSEKNNEFYIEKTLKKNFESINHPYIVDLNNSKISLDLPIHTNIYDISYKIKSDDKIKPVTSYGIVLYTYEKNKYLKYMICQRRDSIAFIQFMRNLIEEKDMDRYIGLMTKEEKNRCLEFYYKNDPHTIWKDLWVSNRSKIYKQDYKYCTEQFMKNVEKYINLFKNEDIGLEENTWFFPKGRKNDYESNLECALREFEEETNISTKHINVDTDNVFEEFYIGSNNILYKTVYFTAYIPFIPVKKYKFYPYNIRQKFISGEVYDFEWLDYQTSCKLLNSKGKNSFNDKSQVLEKINNFLKRSFKK